jgi:hypothetical protein
MDERRRRSPASSASVPPARRKGLPSVGAPGKQDEFASLVESFEVEGEPALGAPAQERPAPRRRPAPLNPPLGAPAANRDPAVEPDPEPLEGEIATEPFAPRPAPEGVGLEEDEALWSQIDLSATEDEDDFVAPPSLRARARDDARDEEAEDAVETLAAEAADDPELAEALAEEPEFDEDEQPSFRRPAAQPDQMPEDMEALQAQIEAAMSAEAKGEPFGPEPVDEADQMYVSCKRAIFTGPNVLSLVSPNLKPEYDELNQALSAFADLEQDQLGFIRVSIRSAPEFKNEARTWARAVSSGVNPDPPKENPLAKLYGWSSYMIRYLVYELTKTSQLVKGAPPMRPGASTPTKVTLDKFQKQELNDAENKAKETTHYDVAMHIGAIGTMESKDNLDRVIEEVENGYTIYRTEHQELAFIDANPLDATRGFMTGDKRLVLSASELGELAKIPDGTTDPDGVKVEYSPFRHIMPVNPVLLDDPYNPPPGVIPFGIIDPHSEDRKFIGMRNKELDQHVFFCGRTGSGKSELMKWLVFGVAKAGYPIVAIDPHGQLSDDLLNALVINCPERIKDIVMVDLGDEDWPVAYNPLDISSRAAIEPTVQSIEEMLRKELALGKDSAPRAVNYAVQAINALCEANLHLKDADTKCTLLHIVTFFLDPEFRQLVVNFCSNQSVRETFDPDNGLFENLTDKARTEQVQPIVRAFQPLGNSASFSAVFSSGENRLHFTDLISQNKIVLVKLARFHHQAKIGEFIGSLILPYLLASVGEWGRQRDPITRVESGRGCRVFVDEAPTLLTPDSAATKILAEARKYDLGLIFAAQFLDQFDTTVIKETLANTASKLSLVLDPSSARLISQSIDPSGTRVRGSDVSELPNFHFYANLLWPSGEGDGKASSGPFSSQCLIPIDSELTPESLRLREQVLERSRLLVCNSRDEIDAKRPKMLSNIKTALSLLHSERLASDSVPDNLSSGDGFGINLSGDPTRLWK